MNPAISRAFLVIPGSLTMDNNSANIKLIVVLGETVPDDDRATVE
jgi:hypothetical protein